MGTTYSVKIVDDGSLNEARLNEIQASVDSILLVINEQMSTFLPESEISKFNKFQDTVWFPISQDFAYVLEESIKIGNLSNGALDITIEPLVNLWGFGPKNKPRKIPSEIEIQGMLTLIGLHYIEATTVPPAARKKITSLECDLSATAKGFGVDKVSEYLSTLGFKNHLAEIGGELRTSGRNHKNQKWQVGISRPDQSSAIQDVIGLENLAMATSGDYWNYFEENGVRYSHTIDPRTGKPITHKLASVTVIAGNCITADGLATAINVMGPTLGYDFAVKKELKVQLIVRDGEHFKMIMTTEFKKIFEERE